MNKKLMSFVLAMVLSVGLGSAVFAANYDASSSYQQANSGSYSWTETTSSSTASDQGGATTSVQTGQGVLIKFGSADDRLSGNLSGIFKYYAGTMIGYVQAGGTYILYDSYGQRAVLSNAGGEHFTLQSWNFRESDLADMQNLKTVEDWNNYLKSLGFSGESLRRLQFDDQGNPVGTEYHHMKIKDGADEVITEEQYGNQDTDNYYYYTTTEGTGDDATTVYHRVKKEDAEETDGDDYDFTDVQINNDGLASQSMTMDFFNLVRETLLQGQTFSGTLSIGDGATGMTWTVYEKGVPRATYCSYDVVNTDGDHSNNSNPGAVSPFGTSYTGVRCMSEVLYNENDKQYGTKTYTFEFDSTTANDKEQQVGVGGHWAASVTYINFDDLTGQRFDTTFNKVSIDAGTAGDFVTTVSVNGSTQAVTGNVNEYGTRSDISKASSVMFYTDNASAFMSQNNEKEEKSYYADNQISYTLNSKSSLIAKYYVTENGVLEQSWSSSNTQDENGDEGGTTVVYDYWRRAVASFNDTNGSMFGSHASAQGLINIANKYKQDLIAGKVPAAGKIKEVYWFEEDIKQLANTDPSKRSAVMNKMFDSKSMTTMLNFSNGISALASTAVADSEWEDNVPEDAIGVGNETTETSKTTVRTTDKTKHVSTYLDSRTSSTTTKTKARGYTFTSTIMAGGTSVFQTKCNVVTEKHTQVSVQTTEHYVDPAVTGDVLDVEQAISEMEVTDEELEEAGVDPKDENAVRKYKMKKLAEKLGLELPDREKYASDEEYEAALETFYDNFKDGFYTDKDGKVYAILSSSQIDLMDGSGFQQTDGEIILVEVNEAQQDAIKTQLDSGDRTVMFMGDVRPSVSGQLTMAVNTDYKTSNVAKDKDGNSLGIVLGDSAVDAAMTEIASISSNVDDIANELGIDMSQFKGKTLDDIRADENLNKQFEAVCAAMGVDPEGDSAWIVANTLSNNGIFGGNIDINNTKGGLEEAWNQLVRAMF